MGLNQKKVPLSNIKSILAIASGKGGVGKSTVAVNIAIALSRLEYKVGLLDSDIYGPSMPKMLDIYEKPDVTSEKKLIPHTKYGIECMSMGFIVPEDAPLIWRGPMIQSAVQQLLFEVDWGYHHGGELDVLVIDLPPGTGDVQLTLVQKVPLAGAIIVSTPQDVALIDAKKGLSMFQKVGVPVKGIIENMSGFTCTHCHETNHIFKHGGAIELATQLNIPFLGEIPLDPQICTSGDSGIPLIHKMPTHPISLTYMGIARKLYPC